MHYQVAQVNIARMRAAAESPVMAGLVARIEEMNQAAESSQGFVWRLPGAEATAAALRVFEDYLVPFDAARLFYNLSVWESVDELWRYAYRTKHVHMLRGKHAWIEPMDRAPLALWWIPAGQRPTVADSAARLNSVDSRGPSPYAFSFEQHFPYPGAARC